MLKFAVRGSSGNEYEIVAIRTSNNFRMTCTCEAGQFGLYCKHRFALLDGDVSNLLSGNSSDVLTLQQLLKGSDVEKRYRDVCELEKQKEEIESKLKAEKKALARDLNT